MARLAFQAENLGANRREQGVIRLGDEVERGLAELDGARADQNGAGCGGLLQRCREMDRAADRIEAIVGTYAQSAQTDQAGMKADAKSYRTPGVVGDGVVLGRMQQGPCHLAGAIGVVLHGLGPAKHGAATVACIAHEQATGSTHGAVEIAEYPVEKLLGIIGVESGDLAGRVDRVDREDGHDAPLRPARQI